jgi:gliding motility-associated-like protein
VLVASGALVDGASYYASQTIGGCESATRLQVDVTINDPSAPTTTDLIQEFCAIDNPTVSDLAAVGTAIIWYTTPTGVLVASGALVDGASYYASQTIGSCESVTRLQVDVTINDPAAPTTTDLIQEFCAIDNPTVSDLAAVGTAVIWYTTPTGRTVASGALVDGASYYATQTVGVCESANRLTVTVTINAPSAPTTTEATQSFCIDLNATVSDLAAGGTTITWYTTPTGTTLATGALVDGVSYYATQTIGICESVTRLTVTVAINGIGSLEALNDYYTTQQDVAVQTSPSNNDNGGGDPVVLGGPDNGIFSTDFLYTPNFGFFGIDSVQYKVCDAFCQSICDSATIRIEVTEESAIIIHNGFSPNGDGINEIFTIENIELYPENVLVIYSRWGDEVYAAEPYTNQWDGSSKATGVKLSGDKVVDGAYYYILKLKPDAAAINGFIDIRR